jgi:uncharacterized protein (TIGR02145 family)
MKELSFLFIGLFLTTAKFSISQTDSSFTDNRDGKTYKTVKIGTQTWMAENLAYKDSSGCWAYNNDKAYVWENGYLYDAASAIRSCPAGWHLPSDEEWKILETTIGMSQKEADTTGWRGKKEGDILKDKTQWYYPGGEWKKTKKDTCSDCMGFAALPAGCCGSGYWMYELKFSGNGRLTYFWTSTESSDPWVWGRQLDSDNSGIYRNGFDKDNGSSVRCVKD